MRCNLINTIIIFFSVSRIDLHRQNLRGYPDIQTTLSTDTHYLFNVYFLYYISRKMKQNERKVFWLLSEVTMKNARHNLLFLNG